MLKNLSPKKKKIVLLLFNIAQIFMALFLIYSMMNGIGHLHNDVKLACRLCVTIIAIPYLISHAKAIFKNV